MTYNQKWRVAEKMLVTRHDTHTTDTLSTFRFSCEVEVYFIFIFAMWTGQLHEKLKTVGIVLDTFPSCVGHKYVIS